MRRVIRKKLRERRDGVDLAVDFNADIAVNVGGSEQSARTRDERSAVAGERREDPARREPRPDDPDRS